MYMIRGLLIIWAIGANIGVLGLHPPHLNLKKEKKNVKKQAK